jgi:glycosyltransferase involved in cell wall biosynthesis
LAQVCQQTFADFELIVCDDDSTDDTEQIVSSAEDPRIRYYKNERNLNMPGNVNRILSCASGEYIVILHDHDIFDRTLLQEMVAALDSNLSLGFVHPGVAWIDGDGGNYTELLEDFPAVLPGIDLVRKILNGKTYSFPICACGMVRRAAYEEVGFLYDEKFGFVSDADMWFRLAMKYDVGYLRQPLITCRRRDSEHLYSGVNWKLIRWLVDIFAVNLERYCAVYPKGGGQLKKLWEENKKSYYTDALLVSAASGDVECFRAGLDAVEVDLKGSVQGVIARYLSAVPQLHDSLVSGARILNVARKRLKASVTA